MEEEQATLAEFDTKVQQGLLRSALCAGDDMALTEVVSYLTKTWHYLYKSLLDVGIQIHSMNFRTDDEVRESLAQIRARIFEKVAQKKKNDKI
jgi:hypothetical protein